MRTLDVRGRSCPAPIIELMRALRAAASGDTVEVLADDRAFPDDLRAWCNRTSNVLVRIHQNRDVYTAVVRKG